MYSPKVRMNYFLRLFDRRKGHISSTPIHAAPIVDGTFKKLKKPFYHYGEPDIHIKVDKINAYSTGLVAGKVAKGKRGNPLIMIFISAAVFHPQLFL